MKSKNSTNTIALLLLALFASVLNTLAQNPERRSWNFTNKTKVYINPTFGSKVFISTSSSGSVDILLETEPDPEITYSVNEKLTEVELEEQVRYHNPHKPTPKSGHVWNIMLPKGIKVDLDGSSIDLVLKNFIGDLKVNAAVGTIGANEVDGTIQINCASGQIQMNNIIGLIDISVATGDIEVNKLSLKGESKLSANNGNVFVSLNSSPKHNLEISSARRNAVLDFMGNPVEGSFEFIARADRGKIICPFKFDQGETFKAKKMVYRKESDYMDDAADYVRKSFVRGDRKPKILMSTVDGKLRLVK